MTGFLVVIIFCIPTVSSIEQIKATSLFRNIFQLTRFQLGTKIIFNFDESYYTARYISTSFR